MRMAPEPALDNFSWHPLSSKQTNKQTNKVVRTTRMAPEPALDNSLDIHPLQLKQQQNRNKCKITFQEPPIERKCLQNNIWSTKHCTGRVQIYPKIYRSYEKI